MTAVKSPVVATSVTVAPVLGLSRPGYVERATTLVMLMVLSWGSPDEWFVVFGQAGVVVDTGGGGLTVIALYLLLAGILATRLLGNWPIVGKAIWREPFVVAVPILVVASVVWSEAADQTFRRSFAVAITTFFGYYLVTRYPLGSILRMLSVVLLAGAVLNLLWVYGLPEYGVTGVSSEGAPTWDGITANRNTLGRMTALSVMVFLVQLRADRRWWPFWVAGLGANVLLMIGTESKTAFASTVLAAGLLVVYAMFRARKTLYGAVTVALIGAVGTATVFVTTNLDVVTRFLNRDATLSGRTDLWADSMHAIGKHPIQGYGWDGFWTGWFGANHEIWLEHPWLPPHAHNFYLDITLNLGLIGLTLWVLLTYRGIVRAARYVRAHPNALGLWPLTYLSLTLVWAVTESQLVGRNIVWVLLVVVFVTVGSMRQPVRYVPKVPPTYRPPAPDLRVVEGGAA